MREHLVHVSCQKAQQLVLHGREVQLEAGQRGYASGEVHVELAVVKRGRGGVVLSRLVRETTQRRAYASQKLANREGLGQVVVRTGVKRADLVRVLRAGGDHDDGHLRPAADGLDDLHAVHVGKPQVKQDDVGRLRRGGSNARPARGRADVAVAVGVERGGYEVADGGVILHDKQGGADGVRHAGGGGAIQRCSPLGGCRRAARA